MSKRSFPRAQEREPEPGEGSAGPPIALQPPEQAPAPLEPGAGSLGVRPHAGAAQRFLASATAAPAPCSVTTAIAAPGGRSSAGCRSAGLTPKASSNFPGRAANEQMGSLLLQDRSPYLSPCFAPVLKHVVSSASQLAGPVLLQPLLPASLCDTRHALALQTAAQFPPLSFHLRGGSFLSGI